MSKILEGIHAYICQKNYLGNCSPMDQLYTLTEGISQSDLDMLTSAVQAIGRVELGKVDSKNGVRLYPDRVSPNYDISSFSYFPKINEEYGALCCSSLRKTLKNKRIRGSKELSHVVLFDGLPNGMYAIDLITSRHFERDIELDEKLSLESKNEDLVCEGVPNAMPQITFGEFTSLPLKIEDITNLGDNTLRRIAEIFHALIISKRDNKSLYIVYNPEDYGTILGYLTITLKLMPASVANKFSFVTCLGKTSRVNFDICCIPTCDKEYISALKTEGNVIIVTGLEADYLSEPKGAFANFLSLSKPYDFELWLSASYRYMPYISRIEHMDDVAGLYSNTLDKDFNVDDPEKSLHDLGNAIQVVSGHYELIKKIENELDRQINMISKQLDSALGAVQNYPIHDLRQYLIIPIISLFNKCKHNKDVVDKLYGWLKNILFGIKGQSQELETKHFEIVSRCFKVVQDNLADNYNSFISYLGNEWDGLSKFFSQYLKDAKYVDASSDVVLPILSCLLQNLSNTREYSSEMRDYLTKTYLQNNPDKFDKIVNCIFATTKQFHDVELKYIFDKLLKNSSDNEFISKCIKYLGQYFNQCGLLTEVMNYIKEQFSTQSVEDNVINEMFEVLLSYYISMPYKNDFASLYSTFQTAKELVGEDPKPSLLTVVFEYWDKAVVDSNFEDVIKSIRVEEIAEDEIKIYEDFLSYLKRSDLRNVISADFITAFDKFIENYYMYIKQRKREGTLLNDRIDFVARELSLLDNKTILKILNKYIGADKISEKLQAEAIKDIKKDRRFSDFAKRETIEFLSNKNLLNHVAFCAEVRKKRISNYKDYRIRGRDIFINVLGSTVFSAVMTIIVALLSLLLYSNVVDSYFRTGYIVFVVATAIISEIIYWSNYKDRRLRNILVMSIWQMLLMIIATLGVYTLLQFVFATIGV